MWRSSSRSPMRDIICVVRIRASMRCIELLDRARREKTPVSSRSRSMVRRLLTCDLRQVSLVGVERISTQGFSCHRVSLCSAPDSSSTCAMRVSAAPAARPCRASRFLYPDDGCWGARARDVPSMIADGAQPEKVWIQGYAQRQLAQQARLPRAVGLARRANAAGRHQRVAANVCDRSVAVQRTCDAGDMEERAGRSERDADAIERRHLLLLGEPHRSHVQRRPTPSSRTTATC